MTKLKSLYTLIAASTLCLSLQGCHHRLSQAYTAPYRVSSSNHHNQLKQLNRQGVGVIELGQTLTLILPEQSFFKGSTTQIIEQRKYTLYQISDLISTYRNAPITVSGYTDDVFTRTDRKQMALFTAQGVAAFLWNHGLPMSRVSIKAKATKNQVASNRTPNGASANRRVEIHVGLTKA